MYRVGSGEAVAGAGPDQTVGISSPVQLDGSGSSNPSGDTLTYQWTQTEETSLSLSDDTFFQPSFTTPNDASVLGFRLVVNSGSEDSGASHVSINVESNVDDIALSATATASSQNTSTGQTADKAIDGVVDGYLADYTKECATMGAGAVNWLLLK